MPPLSPTHAFDPTPALVHDPDNFSPLNGEDERNMFDGLQGKEVHFSSAPPFNIGARHHSIATTNVPLLSPIRSASHVPRQAFRTSGGPPAINITAYIENCRNLNEQLRQAHDTERKAWNIERSALQARIADLEFRLNKSRDVNRRSSNDSSSASAQSYRSDFHNTYDMSGRNGLRSVSTSDAHPQTAPPVWHGPERTPPATRVFSTDDGDTNHLPSISEDGEPFPHLSQEISPTNRGKRPSVDVSEVDPSLDGITLRSRGPAVTSSFTTKITSPQFGSPSHSPSPRPHSRPPANTLTQASGNLSLDVSNLLDPLDKKLRLHAGHTPMAMDPTALSTENPTEQTTPKEEVPHAPAPSARPSVRPGEDSDSYFSFSENTPQLKKPNEATIEEEWEEEPEAEPNFEPKDDQSLKGPLALDFSARSQAANSFLEKVDAKLSEVAAHSRLRSDTTTTDGSEPGLAESKPESKPDLKPEPSSHSHVKNKQSMDDMPKLKIKKSTNFGSAWGGDMPGRI